MSRDLISKSIYNRLPNELKDLTDNFKGRDKDIVLLSSIGVLSNCFPNIKGTYGGTEVNTNLYIIIIAPPASGKGTMNYSRILIEKIHDKTHNDTKTELLKCLNNNDIENKSSCPAVQIKILPANISSAQMYSYLGPSEHGLIIIESEADTMGQMLKNDWGSYSDILRKAFHHETVSISRKKDNLFEEIKKPKLSIVLSGTPEQLKPIIQSRENGLFSRFAIYNFDEVSEFKNVFATHSNNTKHVFKEVGDKIFNLYNTLENLDTTIEFKLTVKQQEKFIKLFKPIHKDIIENKSESFVSNLYRHGLICFRLAMIFTILRNINNINVAENLTCSNKDFMIALELTKTLLNHSEFTFNTLENGFLSIQDENILDSLNPTFERKDAIKQGAEHDVPIRTMDDKLSKWQHKKIVKKLRKGHYKKT